MRHEVTASIADLPQVGQFRPVHPRPVVIRYQEVYLIVELVNRIRCFLLVPRLNDGAVAGIHREADEELARGRRPDR